MLSLIRDLPFIDTVAPIAIAALAWTGVNILTIGPDLIAPRLTSKIWVPACEQGVQLANAKIVQRRKAEVNAFLAARRAEQKQLQTMLNPLMQLFGEEFRAIGNGIGKTMGALSELENRQALQQRFGNNAPAPAVNANYCTCIITQLLEDRVSLSLYSASLRIWKPSSIQQLSNLNTTLITSKRYGK